MCRTVHDVKKAHTQELLALPGVVSVGVGIEAGEPAIIVGLAASDSESLARLPARLEGFRVVGRTVGNIEAL